MFYDQGSARFPEDGVIFNPPIYFGVTDGVSGMYLPQNGPKMFGGQTGGQRVSQIVCNTFSSATLTRGDFPGILSKANSLVRKNALLQGLSMDEIEFLPAVTFAIAEVREKTVKIAQGGDALAIWKLKNGKTGAAINKMFEYENSLLNSIAELMKKHQGDRQKMWEEFSPILQRKRRVCINRSFCLLNGQHGFENHVQWFVLDPNELDLVILASDGLVSSEWTETMANKLITMYYEGGLKTILLGTRRILERKKSSRHEDQPEATALALEF